ncbi:MAG: phosphatidate cytidylyltransferase [Treponema sp.]|jgi:dolichol kinase|nr:phosphatidate cytidylyltransferase [Treponema sp.]
MNDNDFQKGILIKQYRISIFKEVFRKSIHLCSAFVPTLLTFAYKPVLALLFAALIFYSFTEFVRLKGINVPVVSRITSIAARKRDENKFVLGPVTLVVGIIAAALLWKPAAARIGIYALAFGDGLASLVGKLIGRIHIPFTKGKTAAGSLACFYAVFISSFCVGKNALVSLILAFVAMIVEIIPMTDFDNIVIPIVIGGLAQYLLF